MRRLCDQICILKAVVAPIYRVVEACDQVGAGRAYETGDQSGDGREHRI
jgi:hypothetical protein